MEYSNVTSSWSKEEVDSWYEGQEGWDEYGGEWGNEWYDRLVVSFKFKKEWTYQELVDSVNEDIKQELSIEDIFVKYAKP